MKHKNIDIKEFNEKIFKLIDNDWGLIVVKDNIKYKYKYKDKDKFSKNDQTVNLMTASWITFGILWNKPVAFIFIRPTRYTYNLIESENVFSINFFDPEYKSQLEFCGTKSGKDYDKVKECNFTVDFFNDKKINIPYIKEARLIFLCKKIYYDDIKPEKFLDKNIDKLYDNDYHRFYIGEIIKVLMI